MRELPLPEVFHCIEPGPVLLVSTVNAGQPNLMTMSWHLMMDFMPPLIGCVLSQGNYSFKGLRDIGECVLAVPGLDLAEKVIAIGNCSGADTDKFATFGLTRGKAQEVRPYLVEECLFNLECRIVDESLVEKFNFFVLEVVRAWQNPERQERRTIHHYGDGTFVVDGEVRNWKKLMTKWPEFV